MCSEIIYLLSAPRRIHMLGIGGIGMAGLAFLLHECGHRVTGSDLQWNRQTAWLKKKGIVIQDKVPEDIECLIRTTAVPDSHPDVISAEVPVLRRGEVLPELLKDRFTIAVSGTHGKTTTSAMLTQILDCGYCIGGEVDGFDGVARDGDIMVVEADESDGTVACYHPDIAVITNVEYDHMEHHSSSESFEACFKAFIANAKQAVVYCAEDSVALRLCSGNAKAVPYSFKPVSISLPGRHNQLNACAVMTVCRLLKQRISERDCLDRLRCLRPVKRRFEMVYDDSFKVISDYAHHPTEIRAVIETAVETLKPKRLLGVFQPHRYTRTRALGSDFPSAFNRMDKLWLLPVYAASEVPLEGGMLWDLVRHFSDGWEVEKRSDADIVCLSNTGAEQEPLSVCEDLCDLKSKNSMNPVQLMKKTWQDVRGELSAGDVLLIIGAGDIECLAEWARR